MTDPDPDISATSKSALRPRNKLGNGVMATSMRWTEQHFQPPRGIPRSRAHRKAVVVVAVTATLGGGGDPNSTPRRRRLP
ncbi:unnamed protein product [Linum trigynum]|uniref:Uncharacterized protein n=1 Tax=Linum trigynum TaxID=586398 RepID=A0AAV2ECE7_9ROSI